MTFMTHFQVVWTIIVMIIFLAIVIWAWSGKRKKSFDDAAHIPLEEESLTEEADISAGDSKENSNA